MEASKKNVMYGAYDEDTTSPPITHTCINPILIPPKSLLVREDY